MKRKTLIAMMAGLTICAGGPGMIPRAAAEVNQVKVAWQFGIGYLPLVVMQHDRLLKKHLQAQGLNQTAVEWSRFGNGAAMNDALLSGDLNFASGGVAPFLILWDRTRDNLGVKSVGALCSMPMFINTNNPDIKSIKDFTNKDRIAIAGAGSSIETIVLWMAAAKLYSQENYKHFDTIMVNLPHPAGMAALLSHKDITAQFTSPPFQYEELEKPGIRTVLNSYDVTGPATFLTVWASTKFRQENPKTYKAFYDAFREATDYINHHKREAAEIYLKETNNKAGVDFILKMLNDPEIRFTLAPENVMKVQSFMHQIGKLKGTPASWKDLYFPETHDLQGS